MKALLLLLLSLTAVSTQAAVVYSGLQNIPIPTNFDGVYLDVDGASSSGSPVAGWDINPFFGGFGVGNSEKFQPVRAGTGNMDAIVRIEELGYIGSASTFSTGEGGSETHTGNSAGQFALGTPGYLGFRLTLNDNSASYYGWMRVVFTANTSGGMIMDWAYDDTGDAILAGSTVAIPEPSRAMLLLAGCAGIMLRRRRAEKRKGKT